MTIRIEAAGRTHLGLVRRRNEDSFYVGTSLFAIADGLGGHVAGDIASDTVIRTLQATDRPVHPAVLTSNLGRAVSDANGALLDRIEAEPGLEGMGTTLVAVLCSGTAAALANVGDSRAYLLRAAAVGAGTTSQITEDHTYEYLVAAADRVPRLPERLSRYLDGRVDGRSPDITTWDLRPGDRFLLCSDGLSSCVPHERIHDALAARHGTGDTAEQLTSLAIDHGGTDNVTVIVIDIVTSR